MLLGFGASIACFDFKETYANKKTSLKNIFKRGYIL